MMSVIFTESDDEHTDPFDKTVESTFNNFKKWFSWSKKDDLTKEQIEFGTPEQSSLLINELKLKQEYQAPKYVLLCHGLSGFDRVLLIPSLNLVSSILSGGKSKESQQQLQDRGGVALEYWIGIEEALEAKGSTVITAKVPGFGSIEDRANELNRYISKYTGKLRSKSKSDIYHENPNSTKQEETKDDSTFKENKEKIKVNLIAHSMGGLDCRYLISQIENKNFEVVSLTTITTPHHGSEVADHLVGLTQTIQSEKILPPSIYQLTTSYLRDFNKRVPNDPNVQYFSYGASFIPRWYNVFYGTWNIINATAGPNDGMVSVESSKWGNYLGTLMNVDHLDLINWTNGFKRLVSKIVPEEPAPEVNTVALYLDIADYLAKRGL
ncbi:Lipase 2 [Wickerhamomyces ciferrii]|uniref:Lipase 2 n=1 Tax=Wickerhamomyces ciferrii (strain ATCC 14091 / BCRC 22168 / CBS 111 / JCM 3599 / NBRC 0793 / NRRL Y-1031 F-60-10) TaxID=1206466 RepID=K0KL68_WICCF|nr:Lipase 2 [Wickerhamomyces ciferrii]CCH42159.1 Lipase 2 [Wickerhamomyces ciferrii]